MTTTPQPPTGQPGIGATPATPGTSHQAGHGGDQLADQAAAEGRERVQQARETAAGKVDTLADSVKAAAEKLGDDDIGHLSQYVSDLAERLGQMSRNLREKSGDELLRDVSRMARENPALFIAGGVAIGVGISRFARASGSPRGSGTHDDSASHRTGSGGYAGASVAGPVDTTAIGQPPLNTRPTTPTGSVAGSTGGYTGNGTPSSAYSPAANPRGGINP